MWEFTNRGRHSPRRKKYGPESLREFSTNKTEASKGQTGKKVFET